MRRIAIITMTLALLGVACSSTETGLPPDPPDRHTPVGRVTRGSLVGFDDCDALLEYAARELPSRLSSYGGPYPADWEGDVMSRATESMAFSGGEDASASAPPSVPAEEGVDYSGTNVQEEGVEEPDVVKTDGRRLFTVIGGNVHAVDLTGAEPRLAGSVALGGGWEHQLLLDGDRLFVLAQGDEVAALTGEASENGTSWSPGELSTMIAEIDVSDLGHPRVVTTRYVEGRYLTARVVGGVARIVVASDLPGLDFVYPSGVGAEEAAEATNGQIIRESSPQEWLPQVLVPDGDGGWDAEPLVECDRVSRPEEFSGLGTLTVLSMDLGESMDLADAVSVMADGETVYASESSLYVATNEWTDPVVFEEGVDPQQVDPGYRTSIHKFDIGESGPARYAASGEVEGHLLNQFSMSDLDGILRVAATAGSPWGSPDASESFVATYEERDGVLAQLGQVGDLGRGEEIHSVRFIGDQGYVVTFRQTDPLYVIDLSNPADPTLTGELEIPGYSAYLHPAGDGRLIGVGQDATEEGQTLGLQVSLFDVSNPAEPTRIQQHNIGYGSSSDAEWDHHAFLWWPENDLAVLPVGSYVEGSWSSGAVGLGITDEGIAERGRIDHQADGSCGMPDDLPDGQGNEIVQDDLPCMAYDNAIVRSVVVGDDLLTISAQGLGVNALDGLAAEGFVSWA